MSLRHKFVLLVIGITVIPILMVSIFVFIQVLEPGGASFFASYMRIQRDIRKELPQGIATLDDEGLKEIIHRSVDLLILDNSKRVVLSTIENFKKDERVSAEALHEFIQENISLFEFQILPYNPAAGSPGQLIVKIPHYSWIKFGVVRHLMLSIPLMVILFSSLMSVSIVRSIRRSIQTLESATRRIAQGDLNFELKTKGNDDIALLTRSFEAMRLKLKEEYARRARFLMGVSHDLKTPLALIEGYTGAIQDGYADSPEKLEKYLSIIKEKSHLLEDRISHLIELIKLETGDWQATHRQVALKPFLDDLGKRYRQDAGVLGCDFSYRVDIPEALTVNMDPGLVTRALENLINNAISYSDKKGTIRLETEILDGRVCIAITNSGGGISAEELCYIFEPFFRGSNSRREEGFGLGLATVRSIINSHGWEIEVKSNEETVFSIYITLKSGRE
jgi:signal transduction histidine kinase